MAQHQFSRGGGEKGKTGDRLSPNDPAQVGSSKTPLYTDKFYSESSTRVRIGDPLSPVDAGDVGPTGKPYRKGQYAPTVEELATESIKIATQQKLLNTNLPLFTDDEFDENKLDGWNPNKDLRKFGATVSPEVPKHSAAVVISSMMDVGDWLKNLNIAHVFGPQTSEAQPSSRFGDLIIQAETKSENRKFQSNLRVYPKFYKYVSVALKPATPTNDTGVSAASYAVMHSLGHIIFSKLSYDGKLDMIGDYIEYSGWKKRADLNVTSGSYMGYTNQSVWRRSTSQTMQTELSKYSPMDDFAEGFAMYYTNPMYLYKTSPNRHDVIKKITKEYGAL